MMETVKKTKETKNDEIGSQKNKNDSKRGMPVFRKVGVVLGK